MFPTMPCFRLCLLVLAVCSSISPVEAFGFGLRPKEASPLTPSTTGTTTSTTAAAAAATTAAAAASVLLIPSVASSADIVRGKEIFDNNCAGCHIGGANLVKPEKNLKREALAKYVSADLNQAEVQRWVMESGQHKRIVFFKMPDGKMKEMDWADVTTYVVDQALNDRW